MTQETTKAGWLIIAGFIVFVAAVVVFAFGRVNGAW